MDFSRQSVSLNKVYLGSYSKQLNEDNPGEEFPKNLIKDVSSQELNTVNDEESIGEEIRVGETESQYRANDILSSGSSGDYILSYHPFNNNGPSHIGPSHHGTGSFHKACKPYQKRGNPK